jgi:hypothetical protein
LPFFILLLYLEVTLEAYKGLPHCSFSLQCRVPLCLLTIVCAHPI